MGERVAAHYYERSAAMSRPEAADPVFFGPGVAFEFPCEVTGA